MKNLRALTSNGVLVSIFFCAIASLTGPVSAAPVFQMRLVVGEGPQAQFEKNAEPMPLIITNNATGQIHGDILWVSKTVLIDQNDLQTTTVVTGTSSTSKRLGAPEIEVTLTPEGSKRLAEATRHNINKHLAIIIDGRVVSAPVIKSEISGGKAMISGHFSQSEALLLSNRINQVLKK